MKAKLTVTIDEELVPEAIAWAAHRSIAPWCESSSAARWRWGSPPESAISSAPPSAESS